ncbi:MAG TPA: portal protein [Acidovorax sp.]|nr:portal protein [Acidovorax sp.]
MSQRQSAHLRQIHAEAMREFDDIQAATWPGRMEALDDRRFYSISGEQWAGQWGEQFANKPRLEMNKVHLAVIRIFNEYRANRITVDFLPKDGETGEDVAAVCNGLYRADEQDSTADEAYDNAFEEAVGGGMGAWRLRACYENEEDDEDTRQRIKIEPIFDADSTVFFDLDAKRQDKADAKRCYVLTSMTPDAYKDEFGELDADWPKDVQRTEFDWFGTDVVYICEHYRVEEKTEVVNFFRGLVEDEPDMRVPQTELDEEEGKLAELQARGFRLVRQKRIKVKKVHKYILSGSKVLRDDGYIAGKCIPIIVTYGKRWVIDNIERFMGHVRLAKDAQRLINMQVSMLAEMSAQSPREKPIFTPEQMAGHENQWADDAVENYPYLLVNAIRDADGNPMPAGPIGMTKPPVVSPAGAALFQVAEQGLGDLLGNQQAGEEIEGNRSGKAVELIQQRLDMQVFIYMSNLAKAMKRSGEVWLSMQRDILIEENRKMKTLDPQGGVSSVTMNQPAYDKEKALEYVKNDVSGAELDVAVDVGPSSSSRRAATVRALTGMLAITTDPQTRATLEAMALMNMEGEGLSEAHDYFRKKLVQSGVIKPNEEEAAEMAQAQANAQPDPQSQALLGMAEEAQANAAQARAKTVESIASANLKDAQREKTLADIGAQAQDTRIATVQALQSVMTPPPAPAGQ